MQVDLSVVIVTYRCLPFTELCLQTLLWHKTDNVEVVIIDNNSGDGSGDIIRKKYPEITLIENSENRGFGAACNQGMALARGRYYLMLNPDTIVPENFAADIIRFMQLHPGCGAMGGMMVDGSHRFLPESKRGIPTLFSAFCKFSGLINLFPKSRLLAGYYLGHLPHDKQHEIEILTGAFMVLDAESIKVTGGFDERFFMYGEDIDLSYRILKAGYKILYNPEIRILHFKGESTIKDRKYVNNFYWAMELFYNIHFKKKGKSIRFKLVKSFIQTISIFSRIKHRILSSLELMKPEKNNHKRMIWVAGNNNLKQTGCNNLKIATTENNIGFKTIEEIFSYPRNSVCCLLSLVHLSPSTALEKLHILSKKGYKCAWIDQNHQWTYMGWSPTKRTLVIKNS